MKPEVNRGFATAKVAIVGAGLSGLSAARRLRENGIVALILEKSRGVGGRCATRRIQEVPFDHGAQFFTVRDAAFQSMTDDWLASNHARVWSHGFPRLNEPAIPSGFPRYCAINGMNTLPKILAKGLDIKNNMRVKAARQIGEQWLLESDDGDSIRANTLILTAPLPQSLGLLPLTIREGLLNANPELSQVEYESCFALMTLLNGPSGIPEPGALQIDGDAIKWIADNTQKSERAGRASLTIHASPTFTRDHFDAPNKEIADSLMEAAKPWLGSEVVTWQVHRWRFSKPTRFVGVPCVRWGTPTNLILCGDCMQAPSRMEGAILSGLAAADAIIENHLE